MRKTEIVRQLAANANTARANELGQMIESLRQARLASAELLAEMLEPIAQARAALTDETRQTLDHIEQQSRMQGEAARLQAEAATRTLRSATEQAVETVNELKWAASRLELRHYLLALASGMIAAVLVSVFWLLLAPPKVNVKTELDPKAVAQYLQPAISALKPSRSK